MDESLPRRDYPEASFCAVGAVASGLMGIDPDGERGRIQTLSGLGDVEWVALCHAQALDGCVTVEHWGHEASRLENECGHDVVWRACFAGKRSVWADGRRLEAQVVTDPLSGRTISYTDIAVPAGQSVHVAARE